MWWCVHISTFSTFSRRVIDYICIIFNHNKLFYWLRFLYVLYLIAKNDYLIVSSGTINVFRSNLIFRFHKLNKWSYANIFFMRFHIYFRMGDKRINDSTARLCHTCICENISKSTFWNLPYISGSYSDRTNPNPSSDNNVFGYIIACVRTVVVVSRPNREMRDGFAAASVRPID